MDRIWLYVAADYLGTGSNSRVARGHSFFLPPQQSPLPNLWPKNDKKNKIRTKVRLLFEFLRPSSYSRKIRLLVASACVTTGYKLIEIIQGTNRNGTTQKPFSINRKGGSV